MERLLKGEEIEVTINLETEINGIENKDDNIWGLLLGTGYLKVTEVVDLEMGVYKVAIPNYEALGVLKELWRQSQYNGEMNKPSELRESNGKINDGLRVKK